MATGHDSVQIVRASTLSKINVNQLSDGELVYTVDTNGLHIKSGGSIKTIIEKSVDGSGNELSFNEISELSGIKYEVEFADIFKEKVVYANNPTVTIATRDTSFGENTIIETIKIYNVSDVSQKVITTVLNDSNITSTVI